MFMRPVKYFCLLLVLSLSCFAQTAVPDTPAGHQLAAWMEAFNNGTRDAYQQFVQKDFPSRADRVQQDWDFRGRTGGFELEKIEESSPTALTALMKERGSDQYARLTLEVDSTDAHRIVRLGMMAIPTPAESGAAHLSEGELVTAVRAKLQQDAAADKFSGAALIAVQGKPIFAEAYGLADREHKVPNTVKTRFRIGSMNKLFTAVATLQLAEAGKIKLDAPLGTYLTDYPNKDVANKVTIHELLTHTGGTGDIFGPEFEAHQAELHSLQDYVKLYGNRGPAFEPGSKFNYSNFGFILLGAVIEEVSGQSYYDYVSEHIFRPAGMTSTGSEPENVAVADRSIGYIKTDGNAWQANTNTLPYRGTSAGGGYSTVEDLLKFANALQQNKLLNAHYTELLTTGKIDTPRGKYAYGFQDQMINGTRCFGHGGGAPGMNGDLAICPGPGYVVAVLANMDPPAASRISDFVTNRLPGK